MDAQLLAQVKEIASVWLSDEFDSQTRQEVQDLLNANDSTPLIDAFYKNLEFGTAGLRGIMGAGTNRMNRYTVGMATQGLCNYLKNTFPDKKEIKVVIGHDCRHNSEYFSQVAAEVFSANGIKVYLFDALRPTPEVSFAIRHLGCQSGVMITASHNPKEYNGYKVFWEDGAQIVAPHDSGIIKEVNKIDSPRQVNFEGEKTLIEEIGPAIDRSFIDAVKSLSLAPELIAKYADYPLVYTPIHGTGMRIVPRALEAFGFTNIFHVPQQDHVSGDFPTVVSPNPEEPAAMKMAMERAEETGSQLVLASDPDGDRIGVVARDKEGALHLINGNLICTLLIYYSITRRKELRQMKGNEFVVKTIVTTDLIRSIAEKEEVSLYESYTGFKWIASIIREKEGKEKYIGGGEESYGFLWEDFIRDKSSVSACCLFSELAVWAKDKGLTLFDLLDEIYLKYGYYAEKGLNLVKKGREGAEEISQMMVNYRQKPLSDLAGSPIVSIKDFQSLQETDLKSGKVSPLAMPTSSNVLQFIAEDGSKLSIRPSGTEPKIKYYISIREEVINKEGLSEAKKEANLRIARVMDYLGLR